MSEYLKPRQLWRAIWPLAAYFFFPTIIVGITLLSLTITSGSDNANRFITENAIFLTGLALSISLTLWIPLWLKTKKEHKPFNGGKLSVAKIAFTVFLFAGNLLLVIVLLGNLLPPVAMEGFLVSLTSGSLLLRIVVIGLLAPVVEELVFRGVLLNRLSSWLPIWATVLISSLLFGLIHLNLIQILYAVPGGILFAVVYIRTRNMSLPILGHIVFNLGSVLILQHFENTGADWPPIMIAIPAVIVMVISLFVLW